MKSKIKSNSGITLIELLIVVAIVGIVTTMALPRFQNAYDRMKFRSANRDLMSSMKLARSQSIAEKKYVGVYFNVDNSTTTLFEKDTAYTTLNMFEETDHVLRVDTIPGMSSFLWTDMTNNAMTFRPTGQAVYEGGGNIVTLSYNESMLGIYQINVLASTGRVKPMYHYYYTY
jgi:prepilin-type N-terminal cleavage/methylation domain-containing protein